MAEQTVDRYHAIQGETVRLVAQFERNGMVYDPNLVNDVTILDPSDVAIMTLSPQREGEGIYFVEWAIPEGQLIGTYTDQWSYRAKPTSVIRTQENTFEIHDGSWIVRGERTSWSGFLLNNQIYTVTVSKWIEDTLHHRLGHDYVFYFMSELVPMYANITEIRAWAGRLLDDVTDLEISMAIFKASLDAAYLYVTRNHTSLPDPIPHIIWNWVRCKALFDLLNRKMNDLVMDGFGISKVLGDFTTTKQGEERLDALKYKLDELKACMEEWDLAAGRRFTSFVKGIKSTPYPLAYRNRGLRADSSATIHFDPWRRDYGTQYPEDGDW